MTSLAVRRDGYLNPDEARAAALALEEATWAARVHRVLFLHIGLIDPILSEETARFLVRENWLIKRELDDREVLLLAKAVAYQSTPWGQLPDGRADG